MSIFGNHLSWWPELGMGHHPAPPIEYEGGYWSEYRERDASEMGQALTKARCDLVNRYAAGHWVVDSGIGGGRFVEEHSAWGFDVNQEAVGWLKERGRYFDPYNDDSAPFAITCWDSLEHIPDPEALVARAEQWVFVSMPVYESAEACIRSRHYKPGEHIWYWSHHGLLDWFKRQGFVCVEHNTMESLLGREGIHSYAFRRAA